MSRFIRKTNTRLLFHIIVGYLDFQPIILHRLDELHVTVHRHYAETSFFSLRKIPINPPINRRMAGKI